MKLCAMRTGYLKTVEKDESHLQVNVQINDFGANKAIFSASLILTFEYNSAVNCQRFRSSFNLYFAVRHHGTAIRDLLFASNHTTI